MKPIVFSVPASFEEVEDILKEISQSSFFTLEPDRLRKSTSEKATYNIVLDNPDEEGVNLVGLLEVSQEKQNVTRVQIIERYQSGRKMLPQTGSPLTRFVGLLTQHFITNGIKQVD